MTSQARFTKFTRYTRDLALGTIGVGELMGGQAFDNYYQIRKALAEDNLLAHFLFVTKYQTIFSNTKPCDKIPDYF